MIAITLALFLAVTGAEVVASPQADPLSGVHLSGEERAAYDKLLSARFFAIGGVGISDRPSEYESALRTLLESDGAIPALRSLAGEANSAGKVYPLFGMRLKDQALFARMAIDLRETLDEVVTMMGCLSMEESGRAVLDRMEAGFYNMLWR